MYDVANSLSSSEGILWMQVKFKQETMDKYEKRFKGEGQIEEEKLPPLYETQLLEYVTNKRQEYMKNMIRLMELYIKSRWARKQEPIDSRK